MFMAAMKQKNGFFCFAWSVGRPMLIKQFCSIMTRKGVMTVCYTYEFTLNMKLFYNAVFKLFLIRL